MLLSKILVKKTQHIIHFTINIRERDYLQRFQYRRKLDIKAQADDNTLTR